MSRNEIEQKIIAISNALLPVLKSDSNQADIAKIKPFIYAWKELADYYSHNEDDQISVSVIGVYKFWRLEFGDLAFKSIVQEHKNEFEEAFEALDIFMEKIIEYNLDRKNIWEE